MDFVLSDLLIASINWSLFSAPISNKTQRSDEELKSLINAAQKHDVAHLVAKALCDNGIITKEHPYFAACQKAQVMAVYRYERLNFELQSFGKMFEEAEIEFLPLKGSVLRDYYPEPWMRTSCDIDVLVKPERLDDALTLLKANGYEELTRTTHDVEFKAPSGCKVELHFSLIGERYATDTHRLLLNVWDYAEKKDGCNYWYTLSDDMFYLYHVAHMSKHFEDGGCGVRPFVDLFILDNLENVDKSKRDELLKKAEMLKFAEGARALSRVWFGKEEHTDLTLKMETFLIRGGAFGNMDNKIAVGQQMNGGKKRYALSRIFPDRKFMSRDFKYVEKHPWLLPVAYVHRAFVILLKGKATDSIKELKANNSVADEKSNATKQMLDELGLL